MFLGLDHYDRGWNGIDADYAVWLLVDLNLRNVSCFISTEHFLWSRVVPLTTSPFAGVFTIFCYIASFAKEIPIFLSIQWMNV